MPGCCCYCGPAGSVRQTPSKSAWESTEYNASSFLIIQKDIYWISNWLLSWSLSSYLFCCRLKSDQFERLSTDSSNQELLELLRLSWLQLMERWQRMMFFLSHSSHFIVNFTLIIDQHSHRFLLPFIRCFVFSNLLPLSMCLIASWHTKKRVNCGVSLVCDIT